MGDKIKRHEIMKTEIIATEYKQEILKGLKFKERQSFLQIATIAQQDNKLMPKLRTVLFRNEDELDSFQFDCSTYTQKWQQLSVLPKLSAVYLNSETMTQYRFEANAELININNQNHTELFNTHWLRARPDLRKILWQSYLDIHSKKIDFNIEQPCPLFGTVLVRPYYWDIFSLDRQDFSQSTRCQIILENNQWNVYENASNIHPLNLLEN